MPPLDLGRFEQMSARRLESQVEALAFAVTRAEEAEDAAQRVAERRYVQAEAWRQVGIKREGDVLAARHLLTQPNIMLREPILAQEARRELARDSARREEMMRRREIANQALLLRDLRSLGVVHAEKERQMLQEGKEAQRQQLLDRTQELEQYRRSLRADGAAKKASEEEALAALRKAQEDKVAKIMDRNAKAREVLPEAAHPFAVCSHPSTMSLCMRYLR